MFAVILRSDRLIKIEAHGHKCQREMADVQNRWSQVKFFGPVQVENHMLDGTKIPHYRPV